MEEIDHIFHHYWVAVSQTENGIITFSNSKDEIQCKKLQSSSHWNINEFQTLFHSPGRHFSENKELQYRTCIQKNLGSTHSQSFSQQKLLQMIHLYASLPYNNCASCSGPLNPYTWTESARTATSQGRWCSTVKPKFMSHGCITSSDQWHWRCNHKTQPWVCIYIHTHTLFFFLPT